MKDRRNDLHALDLVALCQRGATLDGDWPLAALPRLASSLAAATDDAVRWSAQASLKANAGGAAQRWLQLKAQTRVPLVCQRCLGTLVQTLDVDRHLHFVRSEQEAARLDEESDDDVLSLTSRLDLIELLEDELILALPLVPKHDGECPQPLQVFGEPAVNLPRQPTTQPTTDPAPHPFAALGRLRKSS